MCYKVFQGITKVLERCYNDVTVVLRCQPLAMVVCESVPTHESGYSMPYIVMMMVMVMMSQLTAYPTVVAQCFHSVSTVSVNCRYGISTVSV
jgi:hypothetical protein